MEHRNLLCMHLFMGYWKTRNNGRTEYQNNGITFNYTVKNLVLNNTPQFAAQFMGCYCNTGQVKGVKKRC